MAFYRKKRRKAGPSKNDEKVRRAQVAEASERAAGTLATRFPALRSLNVRITFTTPQGVVLDELSETLKPGDPFLIEADCPGRCGSGSFDFAPQIAALLEQGQTEASVETICAEHLYGGGSDPCGCTARCSVVVPV